MEMMTEPAALRAAVGEQGRGSAFLLAGGVHLVTQTIAVQRSGVVIGGEAGGRRAVLKRGKLPDGSLFNGPLVSIAGQTDVQLCDFDIDGGRFESAADGTLDHRHPLTSDRSAPEFTCASRLTAPDCYDPVNFGLGVEADILIIESSDVALRSIAVRHPVTIGVAVGPGTSRVRLERVEVAWAGQMGIWLGGAFATRPALPLEPEVVSRLPHGVTIVDARLSHSGAAGAFVEGRDVAFERCRFIGNHCDFPFNMTGGQLVIDYKSDQVRVEGCRFEGKSFVERRIGRLDTATGRVAYHRQALGAVAIEASGSHLHLLDNVVTGSACEALHINGARHVVVGGRKTCFQGNQRASRRFFLLPPMGPVQNISITTTAEMAHLRAFASDISVTGIRCEDGVTVWTDGSVPALKIDRLSFAGNDLTGPRGRGGGVAIGINPDGSTVQGAGWQLDEPGAH